MYTLDKAAFDDDIIITKFDIKGIVKMMTIWVILQLHKSFSGNSIFVDIDKDIFPNHVSNIPIDWLKKYCSCDKCLDTEISRRSMTFHDPAQTPLPEVEYEPYMNDGSNRIVYE